MPNPQQIPQAWDPIEDPAGYERFCALIAQRYGGLPPEVRFECAWRDLLAMTEDASPDRLGRLMYVWDRLEAAWEDYRVNVLGFVPWPQLVAWYAEQAAWGYR